ncbi:photosystem I chlorophyll a/b-binding protein 5, chloroplastic-like [Triticum aestivum]|uniref:photosystem I chlorophyll a/b-binding protein 5, chloroplastic-like n=1 Tax=Triticum aestivum TaxID=4565 RepID=UPI001D030ACE|nr:photosystem I chlorophyll a/b-binding protein 5, chloroplastic-like [Triticum aestivum]
MALAANTHGRVCTLSSRPSTPFSRSTTTMPGHNVQSSRAQFTVRAIAERATWLSGLDLPAYLNGTSADGLLSASGCTLPGDYGFDRLGLGEQPEDLKWYVQAELVHCRFAMAGVAGILGTDLIRVSGISNLPVWFEAGAVKFDFANTTALFFVQLLLMG